MLTQSASAGIPCPVDHPSRRQFIKSWISAPASVLAGA
jgi:hypothetical protein